jgi:hypothetical protein
MVQLIYSAHYAIVKGEELRLPQSAPRSSLRINHYFSKSEEEFRQKLRRGYGWKSDSNAQEKLEKLKNIDGAEGAVYSMDRFAKRLRDRV